LHKILYGETIGEQSWFWSCSLGLGIAAKVLQFLLQLKNKNISKKSHLVIKTIYYECNTNLI
jgi:hypothetical protein